MVNYTVLLLDLSFSLTIIWLARVWLKDLFPCMYSSMTLSLLKKKRKKIFLQYIDDFRPKTVEFILWQRLQNKIIELAWFIEWEYDTHNPLCFVNTQKNQKNVFSKTFWWKFYLQKCCLFVQFCKQFKMNIRQYLCTNFMLPLVFIQGRHFL